MYEVTVMNFLHQAAQANITAESPGSPQQFYP